MFVVDIVLRNGLIVDGTGGNSFVGDLSIQDGQIFEVGRVSNSGKIELDCSGLVISPGFIDAHTHSDLALLEQPDATPKLTQGVTTEILGNCGFSLAPIRPTKAIRSFQSYSTPVLGYPHRVWSWQTLSDYYNVLSSVQPAVNFASLIGHGTLRCTVLGFDDRKPTERELTEMKDLLAKSMEQGALGISTGLVYTPGSFADEEELSELSKVVHDYGGLYATHLRNQADGLVESVQETVRISERSGVSIHISHHKTVGKENQGLVTQTLPLLDKFSLGGIQTSSDMYPYLAGSTTLASLLPSWLLEGGLDEMLARLSNAPIRQTAAREILEGIPGWENRMKAIGFSNVIINNVSCSKNKALEGKSVVEIAKLRQESETDCIFDLLLEEHGEVGVILINSTEGDLQTVLKHSRTVVGSDGLHIGDFPHPRLYGTFPRIIHRYVQQLKLFRLEEAIHKMTGLTANLFRLDSVGFLKIGYKADVVVFDPLAVKDLATYENPRQISEGILYVIVNGKLAIEQGRITGVRNGQVLKRVPLQ